MSSLCLAALVVTAACRKLGPDGLWAAQRERDGVAANGHEWAVRRRGVELGVVDGEAFTFAGGVPSPSS